MAKKKKEETEVIQDTVEAATLARTDVVILTGRKKGEPKEIITESNGITVKRY